MNLSREKMLDRMMAGDAGFNGRFITGVHSTGIYCLPSCRARKPRPENVRFYPSPEAARDAGLRACLKCRPDEFYAGTDSEVERLVAVVEAMRRDPAAFEDPSSLALAYGFSATKLYEDVRRAYRKTPQTLLSEARVQWVLKQLLSGDEDAAAVGYAAGFGSSSAYYENFTRATGMTPSAYRALRTDTRFEMVLPAGFDVSNFLAYVGRDPLSPCERALPSGFQLALAGYGTPQIVTARLEGGRVEVCFSQVGSGPQVHRALARVFGLAQDVEGFVAQAHKIGCDRLVESQPYLRVPQTPTAFDGFIWSIVGQQVNLPFAFALRRRLIERYGTQVGDMVAPPTAERVAEIPISELTALQYSERKATYLVEGAQKICSGELPLETLGALPMLEAEKRLLAVKGIGPWAANYILMRALGCPDAVPIGDTGLVAGLRKLLALEEKPTREILLEYLAPLAPYRSLACFHLWHHLKQKP